MTAAFNTLEQFTAPEGGVLLVDKPLEWTSFDVVNKLRRLFHLRKVGHAGTLDPLATGLLILCSEQQTKRVDEYQGQDKLYAGTMKLGAVTASYDAATPPEPKGDYTNITRADIEHATRKLTGDIIQYPPMYSAVKQDGKRLYKLARKGIEVERAPRTVRVMRFEILEVQLPDVGFIVECSKGTYVRTLVHDLGAALGCGAYLTSLRRTAIGRYDVADAWQIDQIAKSVHHDGVNAGSREDAGH